MKTIHLMFSLLACLSFSTVISQTTLSGKVTDEFGEAIPGVNIIIKDTYTGTITDFEGAFKLNVSHAPPLVLIFSYIGFQTQELSITGNDSNINIQMVEQAFKANEVTVTAQLREQALQDVPMSVGVITEKFIARANEIDDPGDLVGYIPGLSGKNYSSGGAWYSIRGISTNAFGIGSETSVGIFQDGVYNGRATVAATGFFDVERVEVLKGPQGTLFGRNASGGVISIHSKKPGLNKEIFLSSQVGNWGQLGGNWVLNYPLSNSLSVRYSGRHEKRNGVREVSNFNGHQAGAKDVLANRLSFLWRPSDKFNAWLKLENQNIEGGGYAVKSTVTDFGTTSGIFDRAYEVDVKPGDGNNFSAANLKLTWILNDNLSLNSITGYSKNDQHFFYDLDGTITNIASFNNPNDFTNFLEELRLNGKSDKLDWMLAASIFKEDINMLSEVTSNDYATIPAFLGAFGLGNYCEENPEACNEYANEKAYHTGNYTGYSVYGNLTYKLTSRFNTTLGLRYSNDVKKFTADMALGKGAFYDLAQANILGAPGQFSKNKSWGAFQPRLALDYKLSENTMIYGGYAKGFKSGGFNDITAESFEAETNNAFEIGMKSSFSNGRGRLNLSLYTQDYQNLQVESIVNGVIQVSNAGNVLSQGLEIETNFSFLQGFDLTANFAFNNAEYKNYVVPDSNDPTKTLDFSGKIPNRSPKTQATLIAQYAKEMGAGKTFVIRTDYAYQSKEFYDRENSDIHSQDAYGLINANIGFEGMWNGLVNLSVFGTNLTDKNYIVMAEDPLATGTIYLPGLPRLIGLKLAFNNLLE